jgi:hypothetical protein
LALGISRVWPVDAVVVVVINHAVVDIIGKNIGVKRGSISELMSKDNLHVAHGSSKDTGVMSNRLQANSGL